MPPLWETAHPRRNLTDVQRGRLALKLKDSIAAKAKEKENLRKSTLPNLAKSDCSQKPINTRKEIAGVLYLYR